MQRFMGNYERIKLKFQFDFGCPTVNPVTRIRPIDHRARWGLNHHPWN